MARRTAFMMACAVAVLLSGAAVFAQNRFRVIAQQTLAEVPGLRIVSIRDNELSACYTLFIMESAAPAEGAAPMAPTTLDNAARERIRIAKQFRDQQLADLRARMRAPNPLDPSMGEAEYEAQRQRIEAEFLQAVRRELPGSLAWASPMAGGRTAASDEAAELVRRALLESDTTARDASLATQISTLDELMRRLIEAPRLAASGPIICAQPPTPTRP